MSNRVSARFVSYMVCRQQLEQFNNILMVGAALAVSVCTGSTGSCFFIFAFLRARTLPGISFQQCRIIYMERIQRNILGLLRTEKSASAVRKC